MSAVPSGIMFSFNPMLSLTSADAMTQTVTINYSVAATFNIAAAGLSFWGTAVDINTSSQVTETFPGESMNVFVMQDGSGTTTRQNNQSVILTNPSMGFSVMDVGQLSVPTRGNGAKSTAQLYEIVNTFSIPEPSGLVLGAIAATAGLEAPGAAAVRSATERPPARGRSARCSGICGRRTGAATASPGTHLPLITCHLPLERC